jgi:hypothetical protein
MLKKVCSEIGFKGNSLPNKRYESEERKDAYLLLINAGRGQKSIKKPKSPQGSFPEPPVLTVKPSMSL